MPMLNVENIQKSFGKTEVLKDISFSLEKGEVLAIIGSSVREKPLFCVVLTFLKHLKMAKSRLTTKFCLTAMTLQKK